MKNDIFKFILVIFTLLCMAIILPTIPGIMLDKNNFEHEYYSYQKMTDFLKDIQIQYPDIFKLESYGKTFENRDIWFVKISDNVDINEDEPGILLLGAHHGDEKISF